MHPSDYQIKLIHYQKYILGTYLAAHMCAFAILSSLKKTFKNHDFLEIVEGLIFSQNVIKLTLIKI